MSRVFDQTMVDISNASGCDWDFVVAMYNHLWEKHGDVDMELFGNAVHIFDWSARGDGRFEMVLVDLCEKTGYTYDFLFDILTDIVYDAEDEGVWNYFLGVTMEHDW